MQIEIPFSNEMARAVLANRKFCTSRNKRYGHVGDTFRVEVKECYADFELVAIVARPLWFVACWLHIAEGFDDETGFTRIWELLHPKKGWEPYKTVWVHWFIRVAP